MFNHTFITELDALLARHGIARSLRGSSIILTDVNGQEDAGRQNLRLYGRHYGLEEQDFGTIFTAQSKRYRLVGVKTSRPKYPLEAECMGTGKRFKFTTSVVPQIAAQRGAAAATPTPVMQTKQPQVTPADNTYADAAIF